MLDKYEEEVTKLFDEHGNPEENKDYYTNLWGTGSFNIFVHLFSAYKSGVLRQTIAGCGVLPRVKEKYKGNIDELITRIKNHEDYGEAQVIFIPTEINSIEEIEKLKATFPDKIVLLLWNEEYTFIDDLLDALYMIDYYKSLIDDDMSVLEKVAMAYDIVKSHVYKTSTDNKAVSSRQITRMVHNDNIVCVGYVSIFNRILNDLGIPAFYLNLDLDKNDPSKGHRRSVVKITDPKYGIDNYFVFDPIWDSPRMEYVKFDEKQAIKKRKYEEGFRIVDALSRYKYFLIPFALYEERFPQSFNENSKVRGKEVSTETLHKVLHEGQVKKVRNYLHADIFAKLLSVIKEKEGYTADSIEESIKEALYVSGYGYYDNNTIHECIDTKEEIR